METTGTTSQLIVKNGAVWRRPSSSSGEQQADNDDEWSHDSFILQIIIP